MSKIFTNNYPLINLYKKMSIKSEIVTQIIFGESFSIIKKGNKWFKIKIMEDNYKGYIQRKKFTKYIKPTHKICSLKAKVYKFEMVTPEADAKQRFDAEYALPVVEGALSVEPALPWTDHPAEKAKELVLAQKSAWYLCRVWLARARRGS